MIIFTLIVLLLDIISKIIIRHYFFLGESINIIDNFLSITYVRNTGAAWSIFQNNTMMVLVISFIVIGLIITYINKNKPDRFIKKIIYSFVLGGALGNFIDRVVYGYVTDFIDIKIFGYDYPIFNVADIFIVVGVIILIIVTWRDDKMNITVNDGGLRIDKYLMNNTDLSRSKIQKMIDNKQILVNGSGVKASYIVRFDDEVTIDNNDDVEVNIVPEDIPLDIVYEDDYLIVVNKPSGMVVHPAVGNYTGTLVNALMYHCNNLSSVNGIVRPGIVHRIDADTSGLLLVAKNDMVHNDLAEQIAKKSVTRKYVCLVHGVIKEDTATIDAPIGRDEANRKKMAVTADNSKEAVTHIRVLERYKRATLIECILETGRTHQIRVHMNYIKHPVVNDPVYGYNKMDDSEFGQMLHAKEIGFVHPITHEFMDFQVEPPKKFNEILEKYKNE